MKTTTVLNKSHVEDDISPGAYLRGYYELRHQSRLHAFLHQTSLPWPSIDRVCPEYDLNGDREHPVVLPQGVGDEAG